MKNKNKVIVTIFVIAGVIALVAIKAPLSNSRSFDESLLGADSNKDGVRDDIEEYIQNRFPKSEKRRAALTQLARDYQNAFKVYDNPEKLKNAAIEISKTDSCFNSIFDAPGKFTAIAVSEVEALMAELFNNQKRSEAGVHIETLLFENYADIKGREEELKQCRFDASKMKD